MCPAIREAYVKPPPRQVLLIAQILIGSYEHVEPARFRGRQQFAVRQGRPPLLTGSLDDVMLEEAAERSGWRQNTPD